MSHKVVNEETILNNSIEIIAGTPTSSYWSQANSTGTATGTRPKT